LYCHLEYAGAAVQLPHQQAPSLEKIADREECRGAK